MANLIIKDIDVTKLLEEKLKKLKNDWITLMKMPIENALEVNIESIKMLQSLGYEGIYITLSKDYIELSKIFQEKGIDMGKLHFIDGISEMYGVRQVEGPNVTYVAGPLSIDAMSEKVKSIIPTMDSKHKFVFLDSITTVLLYNSLAKTLEFSKFLTETLKKMQTAGIMVSVSHGFANKELITELTAISDEIIDLEQ